MFRDFRDKRKDLSDNVERIQLLIEAKNELEARIQQDITNFEYEHKVVIDKVRFARHITRTPSTIYTELSLLLE